MDPAEDLILAATTSDESVEGWRRRREHLADLIHNLRVSAPLLYHRVLEDGGAGAVELEEGGELVVAGIPGALIVRLTPPPWCSMDESQRLAIIAAASVAPRPGWTTLRVAGRRTDLVISLDDPEAT